MRAGEFSDSGTILIEGDIAQPMETILDGPMATTEFEQSLRRSLVRSKASQAVDGFSARLAGGDFGGVATDGKDLSSVREVEIIFELGATPNRTLFEPSMGFIEGVVLRGEELGVPRRQCLGAGWADYLWR